METGPKSAPRRDDGADSSRQTPSGSPGRVPRLWLVVAVACLGGVAVFVSRPRRPAEQSQEKKALRLEAGGAPAAGPGSRPADASIPVPATAKELIAEGERVAAELVEAFPKSPEALVLMGRVHRRFGSSAKAMECWEKSLKLDPGCVDAHYYIGRVSMEVSDYGKAVEHLREACARAPAHVMAALRLGESLIRLGRFKEGVDVLEEVIDKGLRSPQGRLLLGQGYVQLKEYEKAKDSFEAAVTLAPDFTQAHYGLAQTYGRLGLQEKAKEQMERFSRLEAEDQKRRRTNRPSTDVGFVRQAVAGYHAAAGVVYVTRGRTDEAERHWLRGLAIDPASRDCRGSLEKLYWQQGRREEAVRISRPQGGVKVAPGEDWDERSASGMGGVR